MSFSEETIMDVENGFIPISKLGKSGSVRTYDGAYIPFICNPGGVGTKPTIILTFSNDREVICTPDQEFLSQYDWIQAKDSMGIYLYDSNLQNDLFVKNIRVGGMRKVYNINTMTGEFCIGNGLIVSNLPE
jgi:hypothetical protein